MRNRWREEIQGDQGLAEWDMEMDRSREAHVLGMIEEGLARKSREDRILVLYRRYSENGDEFLLGELLEQTRAMTFKSVKGVFSGRTVPTGEEEIRDASNEISLKLMLQLREDYTKGICRENILNLVRAFYKNRARDMLRAKYRRHGLVYCPAQTAEDAGDIPLPAGWRAGKQTVKEESYETLMTDENGETREWIGMPDAIHDPEQIAREERRTLSEELRHLYLSAMLNYGKEPYKVLALCYTRVLYQVERMLDPEEIQRAGERLAARDDRKTVSGYDKMVEAYRAVQSTATATAPKWAIERMGKRNLLELAEDSEKSLRKNVDDSLRWGERFLNALEQPSGLGDRKWKEIVLTEEFTYKQITKLAESIHTAVFHSAQRRMRLEHPELMEEAVRLGFRFWVEGMTGRKENDQ